MKQNILTKEKLKIVWICHFMNESMKEKLGLPIEVRAVAPWISLGIEEFRKRKDIELHVIAPLLTILKDVNINEDNIHYHFIKVGIPYLRRRWPTWFNIDLWSNFLPFNVRVNKIIARIKPDLVNLIGAENAYYSSSVLKIKWYPILVTIQGFVSLNNELESGEPQLVKKKITIEKEILGKMQHFGIEATSMEKYIRTFNETAKMHWFHFPFAKTNVEIYPPKVYDLVFFARVTKMKGIEDVIRAVYKIKPDKHDISLEIIGNGDAGYMNSLRQMIFDLDLEKNVEFKGFIPTQEEMHIEALKAKISILPTYNDTIPGTIVESMLLGLPVISYKTGGIPDLNMDDENLILLEQGDIEGLAIEILKLLNDASRQKYLREKARTYAESKFDNANSTSLLIEAYREVIRDYTRE